MSVRRKRLRTALPNEPVPPVMRSVLPLKIESFMDGLRLSDFKADFSAKMHICIYYTTVLRFFHINRIDAAKRNAARAQWEYGRQFVPPYFPAGLTTEGAVL